LTIAPLVNRCAGRYRKRIDIVIFGSRTAATACKEDRDANQCLAGASDAVVLSFGSHCGAASIAVRNLSIDFRTCSAIGCRSPDRCSVDVTTDLLTQPTTDDAGTDSGGSGHVGQLGSKLRSWNRAVVVVNGALNGTVRYTFQFRLDRIGFGDAVSVDGRRGERPRRNDTNDLRPVDGADTTEALTDCVAIDGDVGQVCIPTSRRFAATKAAFVVGDLAVYRVDDLSFNARDR
jgi:hypothetical protein